MAITININLICSPEFLRKILEKSIACIALKIKITATKNNIILEITKILESNRDNNILITPIFHQEQIIHLIDLYKRQLLIH